MMNAGTPLRVTTAALGMAAAMTLAAGCQSQSASAAKDGADDLAGQITAGREVAVRECASCHALGLDDPAPRAGVPPMAELLGRYGAASLADDLIEGIRVGHEDMPQFDFNVIAADALVAYLQSLRPATD